MIVEIIRYDNEDGREEEFERTYSGAGRFLDESENCVGYEVSRCVEEPGRYIVRIESLDGHMKGFRKSRDFGKFFTLVRPLLDSIEEMRNYGYRLESTPTS